MLAQRVQYEVSQRGVAETAARKIDCVTRCIGRMGVQVAVVGVVTVPVAPLGDPRVNDPLDIGA